LKVNGTHLDALMSRWTFVVVKWGHHERHGRSFRNGCCFLYNFVRARLLVFFYFMLHHGAQLTRRDVSGSHQGLVLISVGVERRKKRRGHLLWSNT
jgi:hypothetical protein